MCQESIASSYQKNYHLVFLLTFLVSHLMGGAALGLEPLSMLLRPKNSGKSASISHEDSSALLVDRNMSLEPSDLINCHTSCHGKVQEVLSNPRTCSNS